MARLLKLSCEVNFLKACKNLNFFACEMCKDAATHKTGAVGCTQIVFELLVTSDLLDLRLDFETL